MKNQLDLRELVYILTQGEFVTATRIAYEQRCSKRVAYRRIRQLANLGFEFQIHRLREGMSGPLAKAYAIVKWGCLKCGSTAEVCSC